MIIICAFLCRFDEMFYGRFALMYIRNTFYFDTHPPLGKMLLAVAGYIGNFNGVVPFDRIGAGLVQYDSAFHAQIHASMHSCMRMHMHRHK